MMPDDLDSLLLSLLVSPVSEPEPEAEPEAEVKTAPVSVIAPLSPPLLPPETVATVAALRARLDVAEPGTVLEPVVFDPPPPEPEQLDPETLLELGAARAWRSGDHEAFDLALARLPANRAAHHRRMAALCERSRLRSEVQRLSSNQDRLE